MIKRQGLFVILFSCAAVVLTPSLASSQLVLGQYEDEAPVGTWNTFGFASASSLGLGGTTFAYATDSSASLSNPALLTSLPKACFTLSGSYAYASFFKYALVNTGVVRSSGNLSLRSWAVDFGGFSFKLHGWTIALGIGVSEIYGRPKVAYSYAPGGIALYRLNFDQTGTLKNIHLAVARQLTQRFAAGVGFNLIFGNLDRRTEDQWIGEGITITDHKTQTFRGYYLNAGMTYALADSLTAALVFRTPFTKRAKDRSVLQYTAPAAQIDIRIEADSEDTYRQPLLAGFGLNWRISSSLRAVSDFVFANWSSYKASYFGEEKQRDFRNVIQVRAGLEYLAVYSLLGAIVQMPVRIGFHSDPQPMKEPRSAYASFSFGTGIHWKKIRLDAATSIGKETGSGQALVAQRIALTLGFRL